MIKPLNSTDLASSKTRSGMTSIADLIPRLIRSYELQAELLQRRTELATGNAQPATAAATPVQGVQETFNWYE